MTTEQREWTRRLAWEGCVNARDLGGYPTAGRARDALGRGGAFDSPLAALTEAGWPPWPTTGSGPSSTCSRRPSWPTRPTRSPSPATTASPTPTCHSSTRRSRRPTPSPPWPTTTSRCWPATAAWSPRRSRRSPSPAGRRAGPLRGRQGPHRAGRGPAARPGGRAGGDDRRRLRHDRRGARPQLEAWLDSDLAERAEREAMLARYAPTAEVMLEVLACLADGYGGVEPYLLEAGVPAADLTASATACSSSPRRRSAGVVGEQPPAPGAGTSPVVAVGWTADAANGRDRDDRATRVDPAAGLGGLPERPRPGWLTDGGWARRAGARWCAWTARRR